MSGNRPLHAANRGKQDEFYTQLSDIENELKHYRDHFRGKTVYCNCDDPRVSNFFHYFSFNFAHLGLKKLVTTCYRNQDRDLFSRHDSERAIKLEYDGYREGERVPNADDIGVFPLDGDGDFRSRECIELLEQADIVVTNPPFSLFREYITQLVEHGKRFLVIGSMNAITYKEIFPLIRDGQLWLGRGFAQGNAYFKTPEPERFARGVFNEETGLVKFRNVHWFTNLDHLDKHNPDQFEIVGVSYLWDEGLSSHTFYDGWVEMRPDGSRTGMKGSKANGLAVLKGRPPNPRGYYLARGDDVVHTVYKRLFIRRKDTEA